MVKMQAGRLYRVVLLALSLMATRCLQAQDGLPNGFDADGGIIVHLGCGEAQRTMALRVNERCLVHGLDRDPARIATARRCLREKGIQGEVSVMQWDAKRLPYADNLINRIVVEEGYGVPRDELLRVLAPRGIAYVRARTGWTRIVKPYPEGMDEWTHFLHDASNNAVADDTVVGQPRHLRWVAPPLWLRSHEIPSGIQNAVIGNGRLFYFFDEGLIGITDKRLPSRYALVARDAFNGRFLWKRKLEPWGWRAWNVPAPKGDWTQTSGLRRSVPHGNHRRMVVDGDRLFVTLGYDAPVSILDAPTGELQETLADTDGALEVLVDHGILLVSSGGRKNARLSAFASESGRRLWHRATGGMAGLSLAARDGRVYYVANDTLQCLDQRTGEPLWDSGNTRSRKGKKRGKGRRGSAQALVAAEGVVLVSQTALTTYDAETGEILWTLSSKQDRWRQDLFVAQGLVWQGIQSMGEDARAVGLDPRTGKVKKTINVSKLVSPEHHHRCYRNKATERYLMLSYEGAEFIDLIGDDHGQNNFVRGACEYGVIPCNGLLYVPPDQCFCQPGVKLLGFTALAAEASHPVTPVRNDGRLLKGSAWGTPVAKGRDPADWPTYRHDAARWGTTAVRVATKPRVAWHTRLNAPLTAPIAADGKVFVAERDRHMLHALDQDSGNAAWAYVAGARIDSPPTVHGGLVLFGCRDGYIYCLRAADGAEVWRFLAAPHDRRIGHFDQLESAWPVSGSVLIHDDVAYVAAGRSSYLDGGIHLYGLDPATGRVLHQACVFGPHPKAGETRHKAFAIPGANAEPLVAEGGHIYMRQLKFTPELDAVDSRVLSGKGEQDVGPHVFSTAGLLDDSWYNRTFWMYSKRWPGFQLANQAPKAGQILVVDDRHTYAVRVFYRRNVHSPMFFPGREGYLLFADRNENEPQLVGEKGSRPQLEWLPQTEFKSAKGFGNLNSKAFGSDKGMGYTRAEPSCWQTWLKVRIRALVKAGDTLYAAGPPDRFDQADPYASFEDRYGGVLVAVSAAGGKPLSETALKSSPIFDGLIAAGDALYASLVNGHVVKLK